MNNPFKFKSSNRGQVKANVKLPTGGFGYIYVMTVPRAQNKLCYIGQTAVNDTQRLRQHFDAAYARSGKTDPAIDMIRKWPLKYIFFDSYIFNSGENSYYGFSKEVMTSFFATFRPVGGKLIDPNTPSGWVRQHKSGLVLNFGFQETSYEPTIGDLLDAAEILWQCRMSLLGYKLSNQGMGGQQTGWIYRDSTGNWVPIKMTTTNTQQVLSILIYNTLNASDKIILTNLKQKVDKILETVLNDNLAKILSGSIQTAIKNTKNLKNSRIDLRSITLNTIAKVLSGQAKLGKNYDPSLNQVYPQITKMLNGLTPREKELLGNIDINQELIMSSDIILGILEKIIADIARKLTTSYLHDFTFYINGIKMSVKGTNGQFQTAGTYQQFTVSVEQLLTNPTTTNESNVLSELYNYPRPDWILTEQVKWNWTLQRFNAMLRRIMQPEKGIKTLINSPNPKDVFNLVGDDYAVLKEQRQDDTLSARMRKEYLRYLSPRNSIITHWKTFFSNLYSLGDNRWELKVVEDGDIAVLKDAIMIDGLAEDPVKVGFYVEDPESFITSGLVAFKKEGTIY